MSRFICPGTQKKSHSLRGKLEYKGTSLRTLSNGRTATRTLSRSERLASAMVCFQYILTAQTGARYACHSWPAASVSPGPLNHIKLGPPRAQEKSYGLKEQLEYKVSSPRTPPNGKEAAGNFSGLEGLVSTRFYIPLYLHSMDGSTVQAP